MTAHISEADIERLLHSPSIKTRAEVAHKVSRGFVDGQFADNERRVATEILRLLLRDVSAKVRKAMAMELCDHIDVPHDVVWGLANDSDDEVAEIILAASPALQESELVELVETSFNMRRMMAVASRPSVSSSLSAALTRHGDMHVAKSLLNNRSAMVAEATLEELLEKYETEDAVLECFVYRGGLPYGFAEKLFVKVADHFKHELSKKYRLGRQVAGDVASGAREVAVMEFLSPWMSQQDIVDLVNTMYRNKRLTESAIIRSLCAGNVRFFEAAMAKRASISLQNARMLLMDAGIRGFEALYDAAQMPESFRLAVRALFKAAQQETGYGKYYHQHFSQRMLERLTEDGQSQHIENMDTLMAMIGRSMNDVPRIH